MTETIAENEADLEEELPPEDEQGEDSTGTEEAVSQPQPSERERELERRLSRQGQELAATRRLLDQSVSQLTSDIRALTDNLSARDQRDAMQREVNREAYLATLPPDKRTAEEVKLLKEEIKSLKQPRTDAPQQRPAQPQEDPDTAYMRQRVTTIINRANTRYGVTITPEEIRQLPEHVWNDESDFHDAVYDLAEKKSSSGRSGEGEDGVVRTNGQNSEAPRRGASSPVAPRAAAARGKAPTDEDVKTAVSTYDSKAGPKASIARLKQMREKMGSS